MAIGVATLSKNEIEIFRRQYDSRREDRAATARAGFLRAFPLRRLGGLTLADYAIGKGNPSFCAHVEAKTKAWANIQGATSTKFGIYYGRTKSDSSKRYRFTRRFGTTKRRAFGSIKRALLDLVEAGRIRDFPSIDQNPLSQMLKAKILCLYFPETFLNVCSGEHIKLIADGLGIPSDGSLSKLQHLLIIAKQRSITRGWSNPRFMSFLYAKFIDDTHHSASTVSFQKPTKKSRRRVDFEKLQAIRAELGRRSEKFALKWEKERLLGLGLGDLSKRIADRRDIPSFGFDFESFTSREKRRYIEVKTLGFDHREQCSRFFLSVTEQEIAVSLEHREQYYFYLVRYDRRRRPREVVAKLASQVLSHCDLVPCAYLVRLKMAETD